MAEQTGVHIGENSPEYVAYRLMQDVRAIEDKQVTKDEILDIYAQCLMAVQFPRTRLTPGEQ